MGDGRNALNPLEAKAIDTLHGQYEAAVQEFYSKVEFDLTELNRYELSALDWRFNWKVLRAGYLTADMALYSGYLFVLLPKVIIVIVAFLLYFRSEQIGAPKLLVMLVAWQILWSGIGGLRAHYGCAGYLAPSCPKRRNLFTPFLSRLADDRRSDLGENDLQPEWT